MPERTVCTCGRALAQRSAHDGRLQSGCASRRGRSAAGVSRASLPPRTGSITMIGMPRSFRISYSSFVVEYSQSR